MPPPPYCKNEPCPGQNWDMRVNQKQKLVIHWAGTIPSNKINATPSYHHSTPKHQITMSDLTPLWVYTGSFATLRTAMKKELISLSIHGYHELLPLSILLNLLLFIYIPLLWKFRPVFSTSLLKGSYLYLLASLQQLPNCWATGNSCCKQLELQLLSTSVENNLLTQCFSANSVVIWTFIR